MILKDFISKLPIDIIVKTQILPSKIFLPTIVNNVKFYNTFSANINSSTFTDEKAIYIGSILEQRTYISAQDLLNSHLAFVE